jgi:heme exporter protein A
LSNATEHQAPPAAHGAGEPAPAVLASGLSKWFDERPVLQDIDLRLPTGRMFALLGANGAGKSTLLKILATLMPPTAGELQLLGQRAAGDVAAIRSRIGTIAHQPMLYRDLSARENLAFFGNLYGISKPAARIAELLDMVGLPDRADDPVKTLSRGMTQRIAIARALMHDPQLLLADEPFDGLDAPSSQALEELLRRLRAQGRTLIVSNHDIPQSLRLADHVIVLKGGRIVLNTLAAGLDPADVLERMGRT